MNVLWHTFIKHLTISFKLSNKKFSLLLVEDEESVRESTQMVLELAHYDVVAAKDGYEAIELFKKRNGAFDFVLLDYSMPGMSGLEALSELLKIDPKARIITMSGYDSGGPVAEMIKFGSIASINKPFKLHELTETLIRLDEAHPIKAF